MPHSDHEVRHIGDQAEHWAGVLPETADAYRQFTGECFAPGELDKRTKQLIALGVALYANSEFCAVYHAQEAQSAGASDRQILEAATVAAAAASGHLLSHGVIRLQDHLQIGIHDGPKLQMSDGHSPILQPVGAGIGSGAGRNGFETEFAEELWEPGMDVPGAAGTVSPSF